MNGGKRIVVIGSINMDLVVRAGHIPRPGETVLGDELQVFPGGKGANQAYAAARLGAPCRMIGCVGEDDFGRRALAALASGGVDTSGVRRVAGVATGAALIVLSADGQNAICVASGANRRVSTDDVESAVAALGPGDVCLLQLEIPSETVRQALGACRARGVMTILDAAPAPHAVDEWLFAADVLTCNEGEAARLVGWSEELRVSSAAEAAAVAGALRQRGANRVVLKLGSAGAYVDDGERAEAVAAFRVEVRDTTAAGDAFNAALSVRLSEGAALGSAARWACAAGALACTVVGAFPSMPGRPEVERLAQGGGALGAESFRR